VGNLDKVWLAVPEDVAAEELQAAFRSYFGAKWAVRDLRPVENLTLERLLEEEGVGQPPNIVVS
jgi:hypothetical protein